MQLKYPIKIIIAWGEAISGNNGIRDWLIENGYPELGLFSFALRNQDSAREWLMSNKFPQFLALINAAEGNVEAQKWLRTHKYDLLLLIALAADNDDKALESLQRMDEKEWAIIAHKIRVVKNKIERDNNDIHKISKT